jgi:hypothetical protein
MVRMPTENTAVCTGQMQHHSIYSGRKPEPHLVLMKTEWSQSTRRSREMYAVPEKPNSAEHGNADWKDVVKDRARAFVAE